MTVNGVVLIRTSSPTISGSAPNCVCQKAWEITVTPWVPSVTSSSAAKARPTTGSMPNTSKKFPDTTSSMTACAEPSSCIKLPTAIEWATTPEKTSLLSRRSA